MPVAQLRIQSTCLAKTRAGPKGILRQRRSAFRPRSSGVRSVADDHEIGDAGHRNRASRLIASLDAANRRFRPANCRFTPHKWKIGSCDECRLAGHGSTLTRWSRFVWLQPQENTLVCVARPSSPRWTTRASLGMARSTATATSTVDPVTDAYRRGLGPRRRLSHRVWRPRQRVPARYGCRPGVTTRGHTRAGQRWQQSPRAERLRAPLGVRRSAP